MKRYLDGIYFRVKTNDGFDNVCFSDLSDEQQDEVMEGHSVEWLQSMCKILAQTLRDVGDEFGIVGEIES